MAEEMASTEVFNEGSRVLGAALVLALLVATIGGMVDPTLGPDPPTLMPGIVVVGLELILLVRAVRLGVTVTPDRVISRGWLRARTYSRSDVSGVGATNYSGGYNRGSTSGAFLMLRIHVGEVSVDLRHIAGRPRKVHQLADQMREALQLPNTMQVPFEPKHRRDPS